MPGASWILDDVAGMREDMGLSQTALSELLGVSQRAVQSWEQGWRRPGSGMMRIILLLFLASRLGDRFRSLKCWEVSQCSRDDRQRCVAYRSRQGHLCWFLTGSICRGRRLKDWSAKIVSCQNCDFFRKLASEAGLRIGATAG